MTAEEQARAESSERFTRRVGLFSAGTMLSRILGVVRESVFAYLFGAGFASDAFNVAFRIPNFLRDLFAESALSAAFVPAFVTSLRSGDRERSWRFAANTLNTLVLVLTVAVALCMVFAPWVVKGIALGFADEPAKFELTVTLTRLMFPFLLLVAMAAWAMGVLNAGGRFFLPATAPAAFNVVSAILPLATYAWLKSRGIEPIVGMAWGVTLGAAAQFLVQVPGLAKMGLRWRPVLDWRDPELRAVIRRWLPMIMGFATWQVNFLVNTFLLTFLREGSVTWVNYAYRIQHLPAGLFGAAIGSVAIAEYAHGTAGTDARALRGRFAHAMGLVSVLTLPAALLLAALAVPVVRLIYEHGRFTSSDTLLTAQALALYCLGIWPAAATRNCAAGFYSVGDTRTPAYVAIGTVGANIVINLVLMRHIGFLSFPLAAGVTQLANFGLLFGLLRRRTGGLGGRGLLGLSLRALAASALAGAGALACAWGWDRLVGPVGILGQAGQVFLAGGLGVAVYWLAGRLLGVKEIEQAARDLLRPRPRSSKPQIPNPKGDKD
ncbi:MAG: murein biosynthesis integral membrane protein MurJ [bacterium]